MSAGDVCRRLCLRWSLTNRRSPLSARRSLLLRLDVPATSRVRGRTPCYSPPSALSPSPPRAELSRPTMAPVIGVKQDLKSAIDPQFAVWCSGMPRGKGKKSRDGLALATPAAAPGTPGPSLAGLWEL